MVEDEELLMALLNSAPIRDGTRHEELEGPAGQELSRRFDGTGSDAELARLRRVRAALHAVIREHADPADALAPLLDEVVLAPRVTADGIRWTLRADADRQLAARAVMAWSEATVSMPTRLRACANQACNLFLLDHSRPGTAKWCSMATCGNRAKARKHADRRRSA